MTILRIEMNCPIIRRGMSGSRGSDRAPSTVPVLSLELEGVGEETALLPPSIKTELLLDSSDSVDETFVWRKEEKKEKKEEEK